MRARAAAAANWLLLRLFVAANWLLLCLFVAPLFAVPLSATAAPMGFKDSQMAMGDFGAEWREAYVNHAFTARDAVGLGGLWMRADDHSRTREFTEVNYTRLLARWNAEHSQANL